MLRFRGTRTRTLLSFLGILGILLACAADPCAAEDEGSSLRPLVHVGERAPSFTLNRLDGDPVEFVPGGGPPSLLIFWSAFCPLCRELTPDLVSLSNDHGKTVRFLSVNLDGDRFKSVIRSFVQENKIPYPVLLDDIRNDLFIASDPYGVSKTPTVVLVDGEGIVRGAYAAEAIRELIRDFDQVINSVRRRSTRLRTAARPEVLHVR